MTIVLLLFAATAPTSASPLFHAVRLFLCDARVDLGSQNGGVRECGVAYLSPVLPSTVI